MTGQTVPKANWLLHPCTHARTQSEAPPNRQCGCTTREGTHQLTWHERESVAGGNGRRCLVPAAATMQLHPCGVGVSRWLGTSRRCMHAADCFRSEAAKRPTHTSPCLPPLPRHGSLSQTMLSCKQIPSSTLCKHSPAFKPTHLNSAINAVPSGCASAACLAASTSASSSVASCRHLPSSASAFASRLAALRHFHPTQPLPPALPPVLSASPICSSPYPAATRALSRRRAVAAAAAQRSRFAAAVSYLTSSMSGALWLYTRTREAKEPGNSS